MAYMDYNSAPVQAPVPQQADGTLSPKDKIYMDSYTCVSAFILIVTFLVVYSRFRLWHTNRLLRRIIRLANSPVLSLINQINGFVVTYRYENDLYLIWLVILLIAYDNVFTISDYSLFEAAAHRKSREYGFLYSCTFTGVYIIVYKGDNGFYYPLVALWSLVLLKFFIRIGSYAFADRKYGVENVNLVAEYMKNEHELSADSPDPKRLKGYKYLVMGEEVNESMFEPPDYSLNVKLITNAVTVEQVWSCKEGLLHPSIDKDGNLKDACLSFALFKLLRRQIFRYPAVQTTQDKTKQLIFDGLLSAASAEGIDDRKVDKQWVFRVVKMELDFLRDLFFTRYPVAFTFGFPVLNLAVLGGMLGVTLWIAIKAFKTHQTNAANDLFVHRHSVDYPLTNVLLILLMAMELFEMLTYVYCDWTKVIMVCQNVKCYSHVTNQRASSDANLHDVSPYWLFGYEVIGVFSMARLSLSINNTLGAYSLLRSCNKKYLRRLDPWYSFISNCGVSEIEILPRELKDGTIALKPEVKEAIFDTLVKSQGVLTNGTAALQRNGVSICEDLKWTLDNQKPVHTIMIWHIATSFCEIHPVKVGGNNNHESLKLHKTVAVSLSNYCAYLVAFHPDLLPLTANFVKYMFRRIVRETCEFFGEKKKPEEKYEKMMSCRDDDQTIIYRASVLGRYLIENIHDDIMRWKIMADFCSELILFLSPGGSIEAHIKQLGNGSEFITHLWALCYLAGISTTTEQNNP